MKIIVTVKTGKGDKSTTRQIDRTVDQLMNIVGHIEKKKNFKTAHQRCYPDGTGIVLED